MCLLSSDGAEEVNGEENINVSGEDTTIVSDKLQITSDTIMLYCDEYQFSGVEHSETFATSIHSSGDSSQLMSDAMEFNSGASGNILSPAGLNMTCGEISLG